MDTLNENGNGAADRNVDWNSLIDEWGQEMLYELGCNPYDLPTDQNPVTQEIKSNPFFVQDHEHDRRFNRTSVSRLASICQMIIYDRQGGPEGDGKSKALRRHWYAAALL